MRLVSLDTSAKRPVTLEPAHKTQSAAAPFLGGSLEGSLEKVKHGKRPTSKAFAVLNINAMAYIIYIYLGIPTITLKL